MLATHVIIENNVTMAQKELNKFLKKNRNRMGDIWRLTIDLVSNEEKPFYQVEVPEIAPSPERIEIIITFELKEDCDEEEI